VSEQNGWDQYRKLVEDHMEKTNDSLLRIEGKQNDLALEIARTSWVTKLFGVGIAAVISSAVNFFWPHR
jgi:hypothetical protein